MHQPVSAVHYAWIVSDRTVQVEAACSEVLLLATPAGEGTNTVLAGTVRGCGKQKTGAVVGLIYWAVGLPLAWWLAFKMHLGGTGLWIGMMGVPTALQMLLNGGIVHM
jgi:MATE family multidrug resistance protein